MTVDPPNNKPNVTLTPNLTFTSLLYAAINAAGAGTIWASPPYYGSGPPYHLWYFDGAGFTALDLWQSGLAYGNISFNAGNVGIGTSTPSRKLEVTGDYAAFNGGILSSEVQAIGSGATLNLLGGNDVGSAAGSVDVHPMSSFPHASGVPAIFKVRGTINQSASAGYTGILLDVTESYLGSGNKRLLDLQVGSTSKFHVDNSGNVSVAGNVGIGTGPPGTKLDVAGIGTIGIRYLKSGSRDARIAVGDPTKTWSLAVGWATDGDLSIIEEGVAGDRLYIKQGGSVGIGRPDPQARLHIAGDVKLDGPLAQIHGQSRVGLASNGLNDLIQNFDGAVYWFKGTQGGGSQGGGTQLMKLDVNGDLTILGKFQGANTVKTWDSGWFDVTQLGSYSLTHTLGVVPNLVQLFFRQSSASTHFMILESFLWGEQATEYGAYVRAITSSTLQVVVRHKIGLNDAGDAWVTSGQVKVIAWA